MVSARTGPASGQGSGTCRNHHKRERVATCGVCESPLCVDCVVHTAVGVKCRKCTGGAAPTAPTAAGRARAARGDAGPSRRWPVPVAIAGAALLLATGFVLFRGGGSDAPPAADSAAAGGAPVGGSNGVFTDRKADFVGAGGLKLGATLTVPDAALAGRGAPGVLIIPGGGAQSRNGGVQFDTGLDDPLYQDLSEALAEGGIVSLRYDKRGTSQSQLAPNSPMSWDDLVADARAGLDFLAQRRETQDQPIIVMGYDQGGFIALHLAGTDPRVNGAVLISTPGRPLAEVIAFDLARGIPDPEKAQAVAAAMRSAAAEVVSTGNVPKPDTLPGELRPIFSSDPRYLRGLLGFDPVAASARVRQPALVVRGGNDGSILPGDVDALKAALVNSTVLVSPLGSNTLSLPPGQEGRFHDPARHGATRDGDATAAIADWIRHNVKR